MTKKNDNFLPNDYEIPVDSMYMKFLVGTNTFRVLAKPIIGMEFWKTKEDGSGKRTPVRRKMGEKILVSELEINPQTGKLDSPKHFWMFPVWNYKAKKLQLLEITQKTILEPIKSYVENPKWGSPTEYDILVKKSGSGKENTKYITDHDPKEPINSEILKEFKATYINLDAIWDNEDPFAEQASIPEPKGESEKLKDADGEDMF